MDNLIEKTVIDEDCLKNYKFILYLMYMYMYIVKSQIKNFLTNATVYLKSRAVKFTNQTFSWFERVLSLHLIFYEYYVNKKGVALFPISRLLILWIRPQPKA